jgi:TPR repeat protein
MFLPVLIQGCVNYGVMLLDGSAGAATADSSAALKLFQHACRLAEPAGCAAAASTLLNRAGGFSAASNSSEVNSAAATDSAAAAEAFYEGCRLGHAGSCVAQGRMLSAAAARAVEKGEKF